MKAKLVLCLALPLMLVAIPTLFLAPNSALAQSGGGYDIEWQALDNGGEQFAAGGSYQLGFTLGQDAPPSISSGGDYQILQGYWAGATEPAAAQPKAITDLAASISGANCLLNWTAVTQDINDQSINGVTYNVYRSINETYFTPGSAYASSLISPTYPDPDTTVFGDPNINAFYLVTANSAGGESDISNRVGVFNFAIVPGS